MKVLLPKEMRGTKFSKVLSIELNDFDIEGLLPGLFFLVMADGYGSSKAIRDAETFDKHITMLFANKNIAGFAGEEGKILLEKLVRTTLITTVNTGVSSRKERVASIKPYSLLALKTADNRSLRQTDIFTYQALKSVLGKENELKERLILVFGKGVNVTGRPNLGGDYDGHTQLDTLTRLSIMFLEGFHSLSSNIKRDKENALGACPAHAQEFGADILRYVVAYHDLMPTQAFMHYLQGLLRFELYMYTLTVVHAINALVARAEHLPDAMQDDFRPVRPSIYLDFTGKTSNESVDMAKTCIKQDIEAYQQSFTSNLLLRQLDTYINGFRRTSSRWRDIVEKELNGQDTGPLYLQKLLTLRQHSQIGMQIEALAMRDIDDIRTFNGSIKEGSTSDKQAEDLAWLDAIADHGETEMERVVALLNEAQRGDSITKYLRWFWNVGGTEHPFSLIEGQRSYRPSWKYAPTNELLSVLVQLAAVHIGPAEGQRANEKGVYTIRLQDFLTFLEKRFGILIDRPPEQSQGAEYVAAARENLRAMLRRLRQMGIFRDLSDDFTAQHLRPPYAGEYLVQVEEV